MQLLQGVVTYTSPVEAFATGIKNFDWWKSSLIAPFRGSWPLDYIWKRCNYDVSLITPSWIIN